MTTRNSNPGNFANDKEKASDAGRKGGQNSTISHEQAVDAGRKGGSSSNRSSS